MAPEVLARTLLQNLTLQQKALLPSLVSNTKYAWPGAEASDALIGQWLASGQAVQTLLSLQERDESIALEREIQDYIGKDGQVEGVLRTSGDLHSSLSRECANLLNATLSVAVVALVVVMAYMMVFSASETRAQGCTQFVLISAAVVVPVASSFAAWGMMGYLRMKLNMLCILAPLTVCLPTVHATFLLVGIWRSVGDGAVDLSQATSDALTQAYPILINTASSLFPFVALLASAAAGFSTPGFASCHVTLLVALALNKVGVLTILPSLLVLTECRFRTCQRDVAHEGNNRWLPLLWKVVARARWIVAHDYPLVVERSYTWNAMSVALFMILFGVVGIWQLQRLGTGLDERLLFAADSDLAASYRDLEKHFGSRRLREVSLLLEKPAFSDVGYRTRLAGFVQSLQERLDISAVDCWLSELAQSLSPTASAMEVETALTSYIGDAAESAAYIGDSGGVEAVQCRALTWQTLDIDSQATQSKELVALADGAGINATIYQYSWPAHVARNERSKRDVFRSLGFAMFALAICTMLLLPFSQALLATAGIAAALLTVMGSMAAAGIRCDLFTYLSCVTAIGSVTELSCRFVCHLGVESDLVLRLVSWRSTMRQSLERCCHDILHAAIGSSLFMAVLAASSSNTAWAWAFVCCASSVYCALYTLVILPGAAACLEIVKAHMLRKCAPEEDLTPKEETKLQGEAVTGSQKGGAALAKAADNDQPK